MVHKKKNPDCGLLKRRNAPVQSVESEKRVRSKRTKHRRPAELKEKEKKGVLGMGKGTKIGWERILGPGSRAHRRKRERHF